MMLIRIIIYVSLKCAHHPSRVSILKTLNMARGRVPNVNGSFSARYSMHMQAAISKAYY
jgi:hypothetical protein